MGTGPADELAATAAGRGRLRASHADREQVIGTLKAAFVQGMLAKDEFDMRVSQAFASRTYAELAAVTADLPAEPTEAQAPKPARIEGEQPVPRPGPMIVVATALNAGVWAFTFLPPRPRNPGGDPPHALVLLFFSTNLIYLFVLAIALVFMIAGWHEKRSGRRPPRPAPDAGGQASRRPLSADPGGDLPPVDRAHLHTAETKRSCPPRLPRWARGHRVDGAPAGCLP
jgi:Domain of unknown function (DUF1707)